MNRGIYGFPRGPIAIHQGKHAVTFWAEDFTPRVTAGAHFVVLETSTNDNMITALDFDEVVQEGATLLYKPPKMWDLGPLSFIHYWTALAGTAGQTFELEMDAVALSDGESIDAVWGAAVGVIDVFTAVSNLHISVESDPLIVGGSPTVGDMIAIRIKRDITDSLAAGALFIKTEVFFTLNAPNDR